MRRSSVLGLALAVGIAGADRASAQELADYDYENLSFRGVGVDVGFIFPNPGHLLLQIQLRPLQVHHVVLS